MASKYSKIFGSRIKSIREGKQCTQAEMAEELNCSQQTINVWENGKHTPKISTLVKVADTYNVTIDWLLGRKEEVKIITQILVNVHIVLYSAKIRKLIPQQTYYTDNKRNVRNQFLTIF